jgi:hypothetical protein
VVATPNHWLFGNNSSKPFMKIAVFGLYERHHGEGLSILSHTAWWLNQAFGI